MKLYFWTILFFLLVAEIYSLLPPRIPPHQDRPSGNGPYYETGIIHVHSKYSDGSGTVAEIATDAADAGMDFLILTDHNNSLARKQGHEHAYGKLDVFVEMEASTPAGHCLTFYSHTPAKQLSDQKINSLSWEHFLGKENSPGVFIAIAHPSNIKNPWNRLDRFPEGMELINFDSVWQRELSDSLLGFAATALLYPFNNYLSALRFFQIYRKDFTAWDAMNVVSRGHFGILAQDAHAKLKLDKNRFLRWPGYSQTFRLGSNVVFYDPPLASDFEARKKQIYHSIEQGRIALTFQAIHPFQGNDWRMQCGDKAFRSGEETPSTKQNCQFIVDTPPDLGFPVTLQLWKDGALYRTINHAPSNLRIPLGGSGLYRVEIWVHAHTLFHLLLDSDIPYIFYNPIYVR